MFKVNKRLLQIGIVSLLASIVLVGFMYNVFKKSVQPEPMDKIAYFRYSYDRDKTMDDPGADLILKDTPVSLIPDNAIKDISTVKGKRLIINATVGDYALVDNFIERGDVRVDVDNIYQLSIKVDQISNFLGTQIKEGDDYALMFINQSGRSEDIFKVKLISIIDTSGKIVTESGTATVDTLNIGVTSLDELRNIAERKRNGTFELFKTPEEFWETYSKNIEAEEEGLTSETPGDTEKTL